MRFTIPGLLVLVAFVTGCDTFPNGVELQGLELKAGPYPLVDSYLLETIEGVHREVQNPERDPAIPNPLVTGDEDGNTTPYFSVLRDQGRYRIWYNVAVDNQGTDGSRLGYMESNDGIHWERPARILEGPEGGIRFGASVIREPGDSGLLLGFFQHGGLKIARSPGGFDWTLIDPGELIKHNHDIAGITWDPIRDQYIAIVSTMRLLGAGSPFDEQSRQTQQSVSKDLLTWEEPWDILTPDFEDPEHTQFYAMDGFIRRGDLLIGMVKILRDDLTAEGGAGGMGWTTLAWSRDGRTWTRDRRVFFGPDPRVGTWDHAHAWIDEQVVTGDTVRLYYGGYMDGHKGDRATDRQIGMVWMLRDRYAAWTGGDVGGTLETRLLRPGIDGLTFNVDAEGGTMNVHVVDQSGNDLLGECTPISSDGLDVPLRCERDIASLREPFRLVIELRAARLYAIGVQ